VSVKEIEAGAGSPRIGLCFYPIMGLLEKRRCRSWFPPVSYILVFFAVRGQSVKVTGRVDI
jgi:hypothetical protein